MLVDGLDRLGWDQRFADAFASFAAAGLEPARVVAVHRETSIVATATSADRPATVAGRFRFEAVAPSDYPAVGDWVVLDGEVITAVLPRRTAFRRSAADSARRGGGRVVDEQVMASNVDVALLVAGLDGDFNLRRIERYLAVAWSSEISPVIVLNKADLATDLARPELEVEAIAPGVPCLAVSAATGEGLGRLAPHLRPGATAVVLGSSGVGKSTLLNALLGEARQATAEVRADDSRGRHTTRHRELFVLPDGALLIDTPGIRSLEILGAEDGLDVAFDDLDAIGTGCRFSDCRHEVEPGCAVLAAVADGRVSPERVASERKLHRELAHGARKNDPIARAAEQRRWKSIHKAVGRHMDRKYGPER